MIKKHPHLNTQQPQIPSPYSAASPHTHTHTHRGETCVKERKVKSHVLGGPGREHEGLDKSDCSRIISM